MHSLQGDREEGETGRKRRNLERDEEEQGACDGREERNGRDGRKAKARTNRCRDADGRDADGVDVLAAAEEGDGKTQNDSGVSGRRDRGSRETFDLAGRARMLVPPWGG